MYWRQAPIKVIGLAMVSTGVLLSVAVYAQDGRLQSLGVDDCGGARIPADARCEVIVSLGCEDSCTSNSVLNNCSYGLAKGCDGMCSDPPQVVCTNGCSQRCYDRCSGEDVNCHDACWEDCDRDCLARCNTALNADECLASCEATCVKDCDDRCGQLTVDSSCFDNCNACCDGACVAQTNQLCQEMCQGNQLNACQDDKVGECKTSCGINGTLFCDNRFVAAGDGVESCTAALVARGVDVDADVQLADPTGLTNSLTGCQLSTRRTPASSSTGRWGGLVLLLGGMVLVYRRGSSSRRS